MSQQGHCPDRCTRVGTGPPCRPEDRARDHRGIGRPVHDSAGRTRPTRSDRGDWETPHGSLTWEAPPQRRRKRSLGRAPPNAHREGGRVGSRAVGSEPSEGRGRSRGPRPSSPLSHGTRFKCSDCLCPLPTALRPQPPLPGARARGHPRSSWDTGDDASPGHCPRTNLRTSAQCKCLRPEGAGHRGDVSQADSGDLRLLLWGGVGVMAGRCLFKARAPRPGSTEPAWEKAAASGLLYLTFLGVRALGSQGGNESHLLLSPEQVQEDRRREGTGHGWPASHT